MLICYSAFGLSRALTGHGQPTVPWCKNKNVFVKHVSLLKEPNGSWCLRLRLGTWGFYSYALSGLEILRHDIWPSILHVYVFKQFYFIILLDLKGPCILLWLLLEINNLRINSYQMSPGPGIFFTVYPVWSCILSYSKIYLLPPLWNKTHINVSFIYHLENFTRFFQNFAHFWISNQLVF